MAHDVLFIHSAGAQGPGEGSSGLLRALRESLPASRVEAPPMPEPENPSAARWLPAIGRALDGMRGRPFVLVGHSLGGSTMLQALAARAPLSNLQALILVATPFWDEADPDWPAAEFVVPDTVAHHLPHGLPITLLYSVGDPVVRVAHARRYAELFPTARLWLLPGTEHAFLSGLPELAQAITRKWEQAPSHTPEE